jgi:hypothetical protein
MTEFMPEQRRLHYELKKQGIERVLGKMHNLVGCGLIPFRMGGVVDMYYFPNALEGTGFATMELIEPDGSGPQPSRIGTFELVAFSKLRIDDVSQKVAFEKITLRMRDIFTVLGRYCQETPLNPLETIDGPEDAPDHGLILDEYKKPGVDFVIGNSRHGLLLVIEVFKSEMEYAMEQGSEAVLNKLREAGHYPYSDLDRGCVV